MNKEEEKQFEEKWNSCNCEGGWDYGQCTRDMVGIKEWIELNKNDDEIFSGHGKSKEEIKKWISKHYISKEEIYKNVGMLRQYLNERKSEDLITDEEIKTFLN